MSCILFHRSIFFHRIWRCCFHFGCILCSGITTACFFCELQPAATDPAIAAISAKLKMCFFIGVLINLSILLIALYNTGTFAIVCNIFFI